MKTTEVLIMDELKRQALEFRKAIKEKEKEIDNPVLTINMLSELDFFVENLEEKNND